MDTAIETLRYTSLFIRLPPLSILNNRLKMGAYLNTFVVDNVYSIKCDLTLNY